MSFAEIGRGNKNFIFPRLDQLSESAQDFIFGVSDSAIENIGFDNKTVDELIIKRGLEKEGDEIRFHLIIKGVLPKPDTNL